MKSKETPASVHVESVIVTVRGERFILDSEQARVYGMPTFRLNEAVKLNRDRFPESRLSVVNVHPSEHNVSR